MRLAIVQKHKLLLASLSFQTANPRLPGARWSAYQAALPRFPRRSYFIFLSMEFYLVNAFEPITRKLINCLLLSNLNYESSRATQLLQKES